ncbi:hypothetical protein L596_021511 [Steinernema carpocapsae]|uniref:Uncharacterized protein n=1 Tax=Steinernema carpocapsae TaxID=34508 RepID=A0A4U5MJ03_STECR|nr:hypothetical protein L596_021511 [Steinernema carpocapsae]
MYIINNRTLNADLVTQASKQHKRASAKKDLHKRNEDPLRPLRRGVRRRSGSTATAAHRNFSTSSRRLIFSSDRTSYFSRRRRNSSRLFSAASQGFFRPSRSRYSWSLSQTLKRILNCELRLF